MRRIRAASSTVKKSGATTSPPTPICVEQIIGGRTDYTPGIAESIDRLTIRGSVDVAWVSEPPNTKVPLYFGLTPNQVVAYNLAQARLAEGLDPGTGLRRARALPRQPLVQGQLLRRRTLGRRQPSPPVRRRRDRRLRPRLRAPRHLVLPAAPALGVARGAGQAPHARRRAVRRSARAPRRPRLRRRRAAGDDAVAVPGVPRRARPEPAQRRAGPRRRGTVEAGRRSSCGTPSATSSSGKPAPRPRQPPRGPRDTITRESDR